VGDVDSDPQVRSNKAVTIAIRQPTDHSLRCGQFLEGLFGDRIPADTPSRMTKALCEMTSGYTDNPSQILSATFEERHDEMIVLSGIEFVSLCEHHVLPFVGTADVGYIPGHVVGISKLARLVTCFANRLQIQERMTKQIALSIEDNLDALGVAVTVRASHSCMACRGAKQPKARMVTSVMRGIMKDDPMARAEFLSLCGK